MDYQNIFNQDHYPTPKNVIEMMIGTSSISGKTILEPSCGAGNIVDYLKANGAKNVLGCEINDRLRNISSTKCDMIGTDFLSVTGEEISHVDMIIMNPPFSQQKKHIMHAWNIAPGGCEIVSLCNSGLFQSYYGNKELHNLVELYGSHRELGSVFSDSSERRTNVECSVIRLFKPGTGSMEFDGYFSMDEEFEQSSGEGIMSYNFVRDAVNRYVAAVSKFDAAMAAAEEINYITAGIGNQRIKFGAFDTGSSSTTSITRERFKKDLQKTAWKWLFDKFNLHSYVTTNVMKDINAFVEDQQNVPFTMKNIYLMVEMIIGTHEERMDNVVSDAFDMICSFSKDNYTAIGETWKTNKIHIINKKFIVPYLCEYDARWPREYVSLTYNGNSDKIDDIDKALCFLMGEQYDRSRTIRKSTDSHPAWGEWFDWGFFRCKGHKKGTMHFEFKDEDTWATFNQKIASIRGYQLPNKTKKSRTSKTK